MANKLLRTHQGNNTYNYADRYEISKLGAVVKVDTINLKTQNLPDM